MNSGQALFNVSQWLLALQVFWWPFCRIAAALSVAPFFRHKAVSGKVRLLLALIVSAALAGALLGLMLQLVFAVFSIVGEVMSTQMGMSMARMNDPVNGVSSSSILYQVFYILLGLVFFAIDGHLLLLSIVYQSFILWPVGSGLHYFGLQALVHALAWVFAAALLIALPVVFSMFLVQFCFGLLNRVSPAMNLFSLGFPITILVGLLCLLLILPHLPENYLHLSRQLLDNLAILLQRGADG